MTEDPRKERLETVVALQKLCYDTMKLELDWAIPRGLAGDVKEATDLCVEASRDLAAILDRVWKGVIDPYREPCAWLALQRDRIEKSLELFAEIKSRHSNAPAAPAA